MIVLCLAGNSPDYTVTTESPLTLTPEHPNATITITIFEDAIPEHPFESFIVTLSLPEDLTSLISLNQSNVTIIIMDDGR